MEFRRPGTKNSIARRMDVASFREQRGWMAGNPCLLKYLCCLNVGTTIWGEKGRFPYVDFEKKSILWRKKWNFAGPALKTLSLGAWMLNLFENNVAGWRGIRACSSIYAV